MTRSGSKGISQSPDTADTPNERLQVTGNTGKMQGMAKFTQGFQISAEILSTSCRIQKENEGTKMRLLMIIGMLAALPWGAALAAPTWQTISSEPGKRIEIDRTNLKREGSVVQALGRVVLDKVDRRTLWCALSGH
jgi:hypothetical protein